MAPTTRHGGAHRGGRGGRRRSRDGDASRRAVPGSAAGAPAHRRQDARGSPDDGPAPGADQRGRVDRSAHAAGRRPCRLFRREPSRPARHAAPQPGRADPHHTHDEDAPRRQAARLRHRRVLRAGRDLSGVRALRGDRPDRAGQGAGAGDGGGRDVRGFRQGRGDAGRACRGQEADRQCPRRGAQDSELLARQAFDARLPRPRPRRPSRRPGPVRALRPRRSRTPSPATTAPRPVSASSSLRAPRPPAALLHYGP